MFMVRLFTNRNITLGYEPVEWPTLAIYKMVFHFIKVDSVVGFVAIGPSKPFRRHDAHKQPGPRVCLGDTFGQSFHRDFFKRHELSS